MKEENITGALYKLSDIFTYVMLKSYDIYKTNKKRFCDEWSIHHYGFLFLAEDHQPVFKTLPIILKDLYEEEKKSILGIMLKGAFSSSNPYEEYMEGKIILHHKESDTTLLLGTSEMLVSVYEGKETMLFNHNVFDGEIVFPFATGEIITSKSYLEVSSSRQSSYIMLERKEHYFYLHHQEIGISIKEAYYDIINNEVTIYEVIVSPILSEILKVSKVEAENFMDEIMKKYKRKENVLVIDTLSNRII